MKTRFYDLHEDDVPGIDGEVNAVHRWSLPGLRNCQCCGQTWAGSGIELPSVDLTPLGNIFRDKDALQVEEQNTWPVEQSEFDRLKRAIQPLVPKGIELVPGSKFGPLVGYATGPFPDITTTWMPFTFLAKSHVVAEMEAAGLKVKTVKAQLEFEGGGLEDLYEFEILPQVRVFVPDGVLAERCRKCGRLGATVPERLTVYADTWPEGADLVRAIELPTVVLCSARFRDVVFENGWLGVRFEDVDTAVSRFRRG